MTQPNDVLSVLRVADVCQKLCRGERPTLSPELRREVQRTAHMLRALCYGTHAANIETGIVDIDKRIERRGAMHTRRVAIRRRSHGNRRSCDLSYQTADDRRAGYGRRENAGFGITDRRQR